MEVLWSQTNTLEDIDYMGKTGTTKWGRVKGRKGNVIMVPEAELSHKRPGPMQRYTSSGAKRKKIARSPKALVRLNFLKLDGLPLALYLRFLAWR